MGDFHRLSVTLPEPPSDELLVELVGVLDEAYGVALPEAFDELESVRSAEEITRPEHHVAELTEGFGRIDVQVTDEMRCHLRYSPAGEETTTAFADPSLSLSIADRYFYALDGESEAEAVERVDEVYALLVALYDFLVDADRPPLYAHGTTGEDERRLADPAFDVALDRDRLADDRMPGLFWCQIVPPAVVETVGEETLLSAPVYRAEALSNGAVLLVLHRYPAEEIHEEPVAAHLGVPYDAPY